jgi:hypothetical protein
MDAPIPRTLATCRHLGEGFSCRDSTMNFVVFRSSQMLPLAISPASHTNLHSSRLLVGPLRRWLETAAK